MTRSLVSSQVLDRALAHRSTAVRAGTYRCPTWPDIIFSSTLVILEI
jgi:hypothetical protein